MRAVAAFKYHSLTSARTNSWFSLHIMNKFGNQTYLFASVNVSNKLEVFNLTQSSSPFSYLQLSASCCCSALSGGRLRPFCSQPAPPGPDGRSKSSFVSWLCLTMSCQLDMPGTPPEADIQEASWSKPSQVSPFNVEEQQLYSELLSDVWAPLQALLRTGVAKAVGDSEPGRQACRSWSWSCHRIFSSPSQTFSHLAALKCCL